MSCVILIVVMPKTSVCICILLATVLLVEFSERLGCCGAVSSVTKCFKFANLVFLKLHGSLSNLQHQNAANKDKNGVSSIFLIDHFWSLLQKFIFEQKQNLMFKFWLYQYYVRLNPTILYVMLHLSSSSAADIFSLSMFYS